MSVESFNYNGFQEEATGVQPVITSITVEQAMEKVGNKHLYQKLMTIVFVTQWILVSFVFMGPTFFLADPKFKCPNSGDKLIKEQDGGCDPGCIIDTGRQVTMTEQFGLYCDRKSLRAMTISLMYVGVVFGNLIFGALGDIYGRQRVVAVAWLLGSFGVLGIGLSESFGVLVFFTIFTGLTLWPPLNLAMIMVNEQCDTRFRQVSCLIIMLSFGVGESILAGIVYATPKWQTCFIYYFFIPVLLMNLGSLFLQDSPKFWYKRDQARAFKHLNFIAKINKRPQLSQNEWRIESTQESATSAQRSLAVESVISSDNNNSNNSNNNDNDKGRINTSQCQTSAATFSTIKQQRQYTYFDLFRYKSLRSLTIASCSLTFCLEVVYFGCQWALSALGLSVYINTVVAGMSQTAVLIPSMWLIPLMRRKLWLFLFHSVSVLFCYSYLIVNNDIFQTINAGIIKGTNRFALSIFTIYINEVYPTCVRSLGNGINFSVSLLGSVVAPLLVQLGEVLHTNAMLMVACVSTCGIFAYFFFKETFGLPLQDEIEELREQQPKFTENLDKEKQNQ